MPSGVDYQGARCEVETIWAELLCKWSGQFLGGRDVLPLHCQTCVFGFRWLRIT